MNLKQVFRNYVSSSTFKTIDGELRIIGKFGQISLIDDTYDIWFVSNPPLTTRKLSALLKNLPQNLTYTRLDREAYLQTTDLQTVLKLLPICGIRRRKRLSKIDKERLTRQLQSKIS